jgi:gliding motility-associated-like protein
MLYFCPVLNVTYPFLRAFILVLSVLFAVPAIAQQPNSCSLVAKMTPQGDSVLNAPAVVLFQNASINATGYQFIIDGLAYPANQPVNIAINVQLMTVKLVAYNGNCTDTAVSYYIYPGKYPSDTGNTRRSYGEGGKEFEMTGLTTLSNQSNLIHGYRIYSSFFYDPPTGILLKTKPSGCIEWGRKIPVPWNWSSSVTAVKESPDGSIYMLAALSFGAQHLTKLDPAGNIIWARGLNNGTGSYENFLGIHAAPDGGVFTISTPASFTSFNVTRFDNNGQVSWQKHYDLNIAWPSYFKNLLVKDGFLYIGGGMGYNNLINQGAFVTKINCSNGQTVWTKNYAIGADFVTIHDMVSADSTIVLNFLAPSGNGLRPTIGGAMRLDTAGAVMSASIISEIYFINPIVGPYAASSSRLTRSGKNYYIVTGGANPLSLQGDGRKTKQIRLDSTLQVKWMKSSGGVGQPRYYFNAPAVKDGSIIGGVNWGPGLAAFPYGTMLQVIPVDSAGGNPNASCYFTNENWEVFTPSVTVSNIQWSVDMPAANISELRSLPWVNYYPEMRFNCPDYIDSCSFLKVTGPATVCNLTQTYVYRSHKNKACGQPTNWALSPGMQTIAQTDSTVTVRFLNFGRHVLYGRNLLSCVPVEDSIVVIAASPTATLNLGPDFQICPGNSRTLRAGNRFIKYQWQDGTTDSVLTINQAGQYWVKVTDSCNNIMSDTVNVTIASPDPISIGNDRAICINDTVHLSATPGFMSYQWSPAYQASAASGQSITVNPLVDTAYTVVGEKSPGCFAYDTVRIKVFSAPPVNLGADKSFCRGDSLILNAGSGFAAYAWNNGANTQYITVKNQGTYWVTATTINGCKAYDTLSVLNIFNLPAPQLDHNSVLCQGDKRLLDAGSGFVQYNWSTGELTPQIMVSTLGDYSVIVTDANGCKGTDTAKIKVIQPKPSLFLPADILICSYETATLQPRVNYSDYLWSNGNSTASITVTKPGIYWLRVTDQFGCRGTDSIIVALKNDCINGVYVPNAFTPDDNGKNDFFKPLIYGTIRQYSFTVFNRWGAVVFQSLNPQQGWDGKVKGLKQDGNTFAWTLTYKLEGQPSRSMHGTVLLLR